VIFAVLIFYILTVFAVFVLRYKKPDAKRPYRAIGYPVLPVIYILIAMGICIDLLVFKPKYTWPGLMIVLAGLPVFFMREKLFYKNKN